MSEYLTVTTHLSIPESAIEWTAIHSGGPGGQNVNKVATGIHLRLDLYQCPMAEDVRQRLLHKLESQLTRDGVLVIKATRYRSQNKNLNDARERLAELLRDALKVQKTRRKTRPSRSSVARRLDNKSKRSSVKQNRKKPTLD